MSGKTNSENNSGKQIWQGNIALDLSGKTKSWGKIWKSISGAHLRKNRGKKSGEQIPGKMSRRKSRKKHPGKNTRKIRESNLVKNRGKTEKFGKKSKEIFF